ncbi:MAG: hypothetical protein DRP97_07720 [Candidatus Latescibacterota bacterium]|nr:MAG: hypothetical protein DRP97_07720 [Candidatus Latescibacterota bacterium]
MRDRNLVLSGTELRPEARIRNLGLQEERDVSVSCAIERSGMAVYEDEHTLEFLAGEETAAVTFRAWTPQEMGTYLCTFEVGHEDDQNRSNNTRTVSLMVAAFTEVAALAGVDDNTSGCGVAFGDYDGDGDPDLYLANQTGPNVLYRNDGEGSFSDVGSLAGVNHSGRNRGALFGDYDNDGFLDLYVVNADVRKHGR